jgi:hypothetical protein
MIETEKKQRDSLLIGAPEDCLVMCSHCRKVHLEPEGWQEAPEGMLANQQHTFSHGICPDCLRKHFPEFA